MKTILDNLNNQTGHYLFPFFWQHGEPDEKINEYIEKMKEQGINDFCVESRPHPEFLETDWWRSMDFIIKKAKELNMKMWILDDAKFPTGYANGKVPDELKKQYLNYRRYDLTGNNKYAQLNLYPTVDMRTLMKESKHQKDEIFRVVLCKNDISSSEAFDETRLEDVTSKVIDGILCLELDNGLNYTVFVLYKTMVGDEMVTAEYLDPMNKDATQILINEVYQKHYDHYGEEFGKTIIGFFSDEPRFGNTKGPNASIGRFEMPLPWNDNVIGELNKINFDFNQLVFLFQGNSDIAHQARYEYMNIVSRLYSENFSQVIGNWCKEKGVDYVGHTIEDNNAHARLGYGTGHYFRGIAGQSIAGIDIIGGQVVPGMDYYHTAFSTGGSDGEFYHYALCKLGASAAKLDKNKNGILMCEAFGAYGWIEGLKMMKWISDHMLSHGVNLIVPHAFDPKEFPDWDCPPHFYAHGNNPQYPYFHNWANYAQRLCRLMSGGYQVCQVGVLYHAFAEWSGDYMPIQKVLKVLQQNQIDCNVISEDYLMEATINDCSYRINGFDYDVLIVPYTKRLPKALLEQISELNNKVIFIDDIPQDFNLNNELIVSLDDLVNQLDDLREMNSSSKEEKLVYYHYHQDDGDVYMFNNECVYHDINTTITLKTTDSLMIYDAFDNNTYHLDSKIVNDKLVFDLHLKPYQSLVLVSGKTDNVRFSKGKELVSLDKDVEVSLKSFNDSVYQQTFELEQLSYLDNEYMRFSGNIKYRFKQTLETTNLLLEVSEAYEIVEVIVNGISCGSKIVPDYLFDISLAAKIGENTIDIIVTNNLARNQRDSMSQYLALEPLGVTGTIKLYEKRQCKIG